MIVKYEDNTIYATRGDAVTFPVEKKVGDAKYQFQPGETVRIKICAKKDCTKVVLMKDFEVAEESTSVNIFLDRFEMKFGEIISKPVDYWYEVELNPDTTPDTFIGYNADGPALFKLFPEAKDVTEGEIPDPGENSAVTKMVVTFVHEYLDSHTELIIQEILKEENLQTIIDHILKQENIESIIQEIIKEGNLETIVQEILKQENLETIVQEILREENLESIIHEILKENNLDTIVQEIIKGENLDTIINEILKEGNIETIVQEILKEENIDTIIQEILKTDNIQSIVDRVYEKVYERLVEEGFEGGSGGGGSGGSLTEQDKQQMVEQILAKFPVVSGISVYETAADGVTTIDFAMSDGDPVTDILNFDATGQLDSIVADGVTIPVTWRSS